MAKKRRTDDPGGGLFITGGQPRLFDKSVEQSVMESKEVECLGMTFPHDEARRAFFLEKLRHKLKDPAFRKIEGFPIGEDEDILALSDPPYYTACPNPFIEAFVKHYGNPYDPRTDSYHCEPFASDVSEGKTDPIDTAHPYHTKVPHKAVMRYLLHFTKPGDLIMDGFSGTGMAAVAAHCCKEASHNGGVRHALLCDLAPIATFIAHNYAHPVDPARFEQEIARVLEKTMKELNWAYQTVDPDSGASAPVDYFVWSNIFTCPECSKEIDYLATREGKEEEEHASVLNCPHCSAEISRRDLARAYQTRVDPITRKPCKFIKARLAKVCYTYKGSRLQKEADDHDLKVLRKVDSLPLPDSAPEFLMMFREDKWGDEWRRGRHEHITHVHHFYKKRPLLFLATLWHFANGIDDGRVRHAVQFAISSVSLSFTDMNRYSPTHFSQVNRFMSGVLYIGAAQSEPSPEYCFGGKVPRLKAVFGKCTDGPSLITTGSSTALAVPKNSVDYVFVDPPFGDNLHYSELNFIWESWHRVFTRSQEDAIVSDVLNRDVIAYGTVMRSAFERFFEALKPGRWMTVEFHNSKNSVWNSIQEAITGAGFIIADVRTLDKKQGTFKQVTAAGAVKQDLIISAYKPNGGLEERFKLEAGTSEGIWDFARTHLRQLPVFVSNSGQGEVIAERQNYLLFDRMVAFHVQRGVTVPMPASEFYAGLEQRFPIRDGMFFLPEQVPEYDKKRMTVKTVLQQELFVSDEETALQWLRQQLIRKPQTFQELHPQFMREIGGWEKHEKPLELRAMLEENFLCYDGKGDVPSQIHAYLSSNFKELRNLAKNHATLRTKAKDRFYVPDPNKAGELEKLRERSLLREFDEYRQSRQKKLKVFRLEAVRAGFKKAWDSRDYDTVITVAQMIPDDVLQEDPKLLMYYDQALTRKGG